MVKNKLNLLRNRIRNNKDIKALVENFISLSALKLLSFILPLITLPYLSRVIGLEHFGDISLMTLSDKYYVILK